MAPNELFDFHKQLDVGNSGEHEFVQRYHGLKPRKSEDRKIDFVLSSGQTVELKTDTYDMNRTENFFMELYSDIATTKIGGPWRALADGLDYFVYYFPKNQTYFWFKPEKLCGMIDYIVKERGLQLKNIRNKGWTAQGYAVPRLDLESVCERVDAFPPDIIDF